MAKLLLVEDNELNRDMLSRRLRRRGYEVEIATDGAQAVEIATERAFDLILMDMSLPVMDGWEATRRLKAQESTQAVPIIALTAHAMVGDRESALAAGCNDYDTKPVELKRLINKIKTFVPETAAPPARPAQTAVTAAPTADAAPVEGTVLVVDDNEDNRDMLTRRLQRRGYQVSLAESGEEALEQMSSRLPRLILLDIMMPGMDGIETLQRIRADHSRHQLPVIMVTAKAESNDMVRAFELGANDYITKPIDFAVALARIQMHLTTAQAAQQAATPSPPTAPPQPQPAAAAAPAPTPPSTPPSPSVPPSPSILPSPPTSPRPWMAPAAFTPPTEPLFANRYLIQAPLRQDILGPVSAAQDQHTQQPVLLHVFKADPGPESERLATAFMQEIGELSQVRSHLPPLDYGQAQGNFYLAHNVGAQGNNFNRDRLLHSVLATRQPWPLDNVIALMDSLLSQLAPFHEQQRPHGGIRADAFFQLTATSVTLVDSGLGKRVLMRLSQQSAEYRKRLLAERDYLALEQRIGRLVMSSDLYAAGLVGLQALTGKSLSSLTGRGSGIDWQRHVNVPSEVAAWFDNLVSGNQIERYEQALAARAALQSLSYSEAVVE